MTRLSHKSLVLPLLAGLMSCAPGTSPGAPRLTSVAESPAASTDWPTAGQNFDGTHYSAVDQIDRGNVQRLGLAWSLELPFEHTLEATPLAINGILYFSGQLSKVYAVDAVSGQLLWTYDPESWKYRPENQPTMFPVNRGVAYWQGRIFVATRDGRLIGIDAATGRELWVRQTLDPSSKKFITGAPLAFEGKVVIGNGGSDYGERGYLTAYSAESGEQLWRFFTAPGDPAKGHENAAMRMAASTWRGEYWKVGTGGGPWNGFTYDAGLNRLYIGSGNSGPYDPELRSPGGGDNLFLASIVAVDADTGEYIWHYQVNPREAWDFKATMNIVLADLEIEGKKTPVLMQAPSNGFFYVLDRRTGRLISAEKTGKVTWAERIDLKTGRPVEAPNIRYEDGPVTLWPSPFGTHNWQPMSYSPRTGLVYIPTLKAAGTYKRSSDTFFEGAGTEFTIEKIDDDDGTGKLLAWDPVTQTQRWSVQKPNLWNGGILSTGGDLVFEGDFEGALNAYDALSGQKLWSFDAGLGIIAAPITYEAAGKQYVSVLVGYGGSTQTLSRFTRAGWAYGAQPRRLLTFALDAKAKLPHTPPRDFSFAPLDDPSITIDESAAARGARLYNTKSCVVCHGLDAISSGAPGPDLRASGIAGDLEGFREFVRGGQLAAFGMPRFDNINDAEMRDLYMYIRRAARAAAAGNAGQGGGGVRFR